MVRSKYWICTYSFVVCLFLIILLWGNRAVTVVSENLSGERRHCIIIDPGHGGEDGGAVSYTGEPESHYNLEISYILKDLLNFLGYSTKMLRTENISIYSSGTTLAQKKISDLKERVRIANETGNAIFLSIHQNHFSDNRYSGAQVFYAAFDGSKALAETIQDSFTSALNTRNKRQIKKGSGIYLMEHIQCPGVLVECGFLSNPEENAKLKNPEYQKQLCSIIATSLSRYISNT